MDGKDNLDKYLLRFERYASVAKWNRSTRATQLSPLLTDKAVEVCNRLSPEEAMVYQRLKVALLERYDFTERGYREKFREARPEGHESPSQFIFRLKNYFTKSIELAEVEQTFMGVVDLIIREQFTSSCSKDLSIWLKQCNSKTLDELSRLADQYLATRNQKLSSKEVIKRESARAGVKDDHSGFPPASTLKCFLCNRVGHRAIDCRVKPEGGEMNITQQLDTQSRATNVVKLGMRRGTVGTTPALKLLLGEEATPSDLRHNRSELDALHKLEDYRMMQKRKMENIWSLNRERKLTSCVMVLA